MITNPCTAKCKVQHIRLERKQAQLAWYWLVLEVEETDSFSDTPSKEPPNVRHLLQVGLNSQSFDINVAQMKAVWYPEDLHNL